MLKKKNLLNRIVIRISLEIKLLLLQIVRFFKKTNAESSILIFSDPRGGSTWLTELINHIDQSIVYWEPLFPKYNPTIIEIGFSWRQHIPINAKWIEAKKAFDQILKLDIINEWTTMRFNVFKFVKCKIPIIKFCRGNHLIHWLCKQYSFKYKPIVLLRHPFSVAASQLKQGGWGYPFTKFQIPTNRYNDTYIKHKVFLESLGSKEECLVATWCITNKDLCNSNENWNLLFYELLITDPMKYLDPIFHDWGISVKSSLEENLNNASATNVDFEKNITKQLRKWNYYFDEQTIDKLQAILDHFEINIYSKHSLYPNT